ncbi:tyrosine-type recombinase/integrase [Streptomyces sp. NPDC088707]|uniref:tyrosine-type recombinase/integrase n=1 Tax=Streptomyces sp. NPDC088707 TaxID=3365871 RepID=UPI0038002667
MTSIAPTLQSFFTDRLVRQRQVSVAAHRDALRLLLGFVHQRTGNAPERLDWTDLDADAVSAFLNYLEDERGNSARTRNVRLTAIRSLFSYAALQHPEHALLIQRVLDIPPKRFDKRSDLPDRRRGRRPVGGAGSAALGGPGDKAMLALAVWTGLRVSELTSLDCDDVTLGDGESVRCEGKGRKHRAVPLDRSIQDLLRAWLGERSGKRGDPLFCTRTGRRLTRDAVAQRLAIHVRAAAEACPTLLDKRVHPHVLRHSCAMSLLQAGVDTTVIALWLGHAGVRSTDAYVHADMTIKEKALSLTAPVTARPGRYQPTDKVLAFLDRL